MVKDDFLLSTSKEVEYIYISKEVLEELINILKDELASDHKYTDCGGDMSVSCKNGTCNCSYALKCSGVYKKDKQLEKRFNELLKKLN